MDCEGSPELSSLAFDEKRTKGNELVFIDIGKINGQVAWLEATGVADARSEPA